ncbi:MAG: hypothetical protein DRN29_04750 [Thermoplasmata archaeon]|nr:MAG: hypothetical protein DRN29_04750 [Thermoplasmata archaeon]
MTVHQNTLKLINLERQILELGFWKKYPNKDFSYELAKTTGELGDEYPSDKAIRLAEQWVTEFKETGKIKSFEEEG